MRKRVFSALLFGCAVLQGTACKRQPAEDSDVEMARGALARGPEPFLRSFVTLMSELNESKASFCGGVLLGPRHVLTAAHCIDSVKNIKVSRFDSQLKRSEISAGAWQGHPEWEKMRDKSGPQAHRSDLGIVILATPVTGSFAKISASRDSNVRDAVYVGAGQSDANKFDQKIRYSKNVSAFRLIFRPDGATWISRGAAALCSGDSGGPLFASDGSLLGIASAIVSSAAQARECGKGVAAYHSDVQESIVWIVCSFAKAGHPLPNFPIPSAESCR